MNLTDRHRLLAGQRQNAQRRYVSLLLTAVIWSGVTVADQASLHTVNATVQEKVAELIQDALGPYRTDADSASNPTNIMARLQSVEASFREASSLMPTRLDLRYGMASALILQALQTNSHFYLNVSKALAVYQQIHALDTNGFEAPLLYAAFTRATGENGSSDEALRQLLMIHPQRTAEYLDRFHRVEGILGMVPHTEPQYDMPTNCNHAIVVLGAALETNGTIKTKLVGRLEQALKLARIYPQAPLILTGGNQRGGITEAYAMSLWLKNRGVSDDRLHLEDKARDTLGNAFYSAAILEKLNVTHVTLVTSVTHLRRGLADLQELCRQRGLNLTFTTLAAPEEQELDTCRERLAVYRDTMRASGVWAFPGIQR